MITETEITDHIKKIERNDFFGYQTSDLIEFLPFEAARPYLKETATEAEFDKIRKEPTRDNAIAEIKSYMAFAWGKANDARGLSADRSIQHMLAWTFIADDGVYDQLLASYDSSYEFYGKPQLVLVCEAYGIDWKALDNDSWSNDEGDGVPAAQALGRVAA